MPAALRRPPARRAVSAPIARCAAALVLCLPAAVVPPAPVARAAALVAGDLVMIQAPQWYAGQPVLRVDPNSGAPIETISGGWELVDPWALCILPPGRIVVADRAAGLVEIDAATGAQSVLVPLAGFGGSGPTGVAREATGNLVVVCGDATGIWRVTPTGTVLGAFSAHGIVTYANAIAVGPGGVLWVADGAGRVVSVDPVSGAQTELAVSGVPWATPVRIAVGAGGSKLYVVNRGVFSYHHSGGAYEIDVTSGAGSHVPDTYQWVDGLAVDPVSGAVYVATVWTIEQDLPTYAQIVKGTGGSWSVISPSQQRLSGPLTVVPPLDASPAVPVTWGRLKASLR